MEKITINASGKQVLEVKDKELEIEILEGVSAELYVFASGKVNQKTHLKKDATLSSAYLWLEEGEGTFENVLEGNNSTTHESHFFIEEGKLKIKTTLLHRGKDTRGSILARGLVKKKGNVRLDGMIKIEKEGEGADSILEEHVLLLDPTSSAIANPELEIENNDVSSTHAASVAQLREEHIFYLMSRGIPRQEAKKMLLRGFVTKGLDRIPDKEIREKFESMLISRV